MTIAKISLHCILNGGSAARNIFSGIGKVLSTTQYRLPYQASEHYEILKSCSNLGRRTHRILQKDFFQLPVVFLQKR